LHLAILRSQGNDRSLPMAGAIYVQYTAIMPIMNHFSSKNDVSILLNNSSCVSRN
jgi:hypothetical protein